MQAAERPPQPATHWLWSEAYERWYEPGTSPVNGQRPPDATRWYKGDPRAAENGTKGGIISAKARAKLAASDIDVDKIVARWIRDAQRGDNRAREQLLDRLEGKVEQSIHATVESRYVIEEAGCAYVDAGPTLTVAASDNIHYDAQCADGSRVAPMELEPKSETGGADPVPGVPPPTQEAPPQGGPMPPKNLEPEE